MATQAKATPPKKTPSPRRRPAKKPVAPSVLHVGFVWDMSGSMQDIRDASVEGTRGYLADLQEEEAKIVKEHGDGVYTYMTVTAFDEFFETWVDNVPAAEFNLDSLNRYQPRGRTALNDAVAHTVAQMSQRVKEGEKVLVVVMTDGYENASKEYGGDVGKKRLSKMVKAYEAKGNWTFVYLGANVDSIQEAAAIGIPSGNAVYYSPNAFSVSATTGTLGNVTSSLRWSSTSNSVRAFADAGESNDYRSNSGGSDV